MRAGLKLFGLALLWAQLSACPSARQAEQGQPAGGSAAKQVATEAPRPFFPILDVVCDTGIGVAGRRAIGTAFIVRLPGNDGKEPAIALTAAHVAAERAACKHFYLLGNPIRGSLNEPCLFEVVQVDFPLQDRNLNLTFPLDVGALRVAAADNVSGLCGITNRVRVRLALPIDRRGSDLVTILRRETGGAVDLAGLQALRFTVIDWGHEALHGMTLQVSEPASSRIGGGYSGAPVVVGRLAAGDLEAVGLITDQLAGLDLGNAAASPTALAQRVLDASGLPPTGVEGLAKVVPESPAASRVIRRVAACRLQDSEMRGFAGQFDAFDLLHIVSKAFDASSACGEIDRLRQQGLLRDALSSYYSSALLERIWPHFSVAPDGVKPEHIARIRRCADGVFPPGDAPEVLIETLHAYALSVYYRLFEGDAAGLNHAQWALVDKAKCESYLRFYKANPNIVLQNLLLQDRLFGRKAAVRGVRDYADIFRLMLDDRRGVDGDEGLMRSHRHRTAVLSFRLYDLCFRMRPHCPAAWEDVATAARGAALFGEGGAITDALDEKGDFARHLQALLVDSRALARRRPDWSSLYTPNEIDEGLLAVVERLMQDAGGSVCVRTHAQAYRRPDSKMPRTCGREERTSSPARRA